MLGDENSIALLSKMMEMSTGRQKVIAHNIANANTTGYSRREFEFEDKLKEILNLFEKNKHLMQTRRGIYIYGSPGSGKTYFVKEILKKLDYDTILFDAGDFRNKTVIDTITKHNMSDTNILSLFKKKTKKLDIIMDEIDGMNSGDKGGINSLIK